MADFFTIHSLSEELEKVTFCPYLFHDGSPYHIETSPLICRELIVRVNYFPILGKNFPQSHLIVIR